GRMGAFTPGRGATGCPLVGTGIGLLFRLRRPALRRPISTSEILDNDGVAHLHLFLVRQLPLQVVRREQDALHHRKEDALFELLASRLHRFGVTSVQVAVLDKKVRQILLYFRAVDVETTLLSRDVGWDV